MLICDYLWLILLECDVAEDLPAMQASVYGKRRILPALSRALRLESGILGKRRLSNRNDSAGFHRNFLLDFSFSRSIFQIVFLTRTNTKRHGNNLIFFRAISCFFVSNFFFPYLPIALEHQPNSRQSGQLFWNCRTCA